MMVGADAEVAEEEEAVENITIIGILGQAPHPRLHRTQQLVAQQHTLEHHVAEQQLERRTEIRITVIADGKTFKLFFR